MYTQQQFTREIKHFQGNKDVSYSFTYTVVRKNGKVENIFNEFGFSVEKNSECFEYFKNL